MLLTHEFEVPASFDEAWTTILDIPRVARCIPGASLTEVRGEEVEGAVQVKIGPVSLEYAGLARITKIDREAGQIQLTGEGADKRGRGTVTAVITARMSPSPSGTHVEVQTDLRLTGKPAQFGRGAITEVGEKLMGQFSDSLAGLMIGSGTGISDATRPAQRDASRDNSLNLIGVVAWPVAKRLLAVAAFGAASLIVLAWIIRRSKSA